MTLSAPIEIEIWRSDRNRHEVHYFINNGQMPGYQPQGDYLFGVNPKFFNEAKVKRIIAMLDESS